jgi:sugar transferase (PEP-CTERM/EpsH1 system associated)
VTQVRSQAAGIRPDHRPLVVHVMHRFDVGGLENGVVNLINRLPADRFRHAVVALTEITDFSRRISRDDVTLAALHKPPGQGLWMAPRMHALLREWQPAIVHTRNFGALDMQLPAAWARVPVRIHGEHGWDVDDPDGLSRKHQLVRRAYRPLVHHYVALSRHLQRYLTARVGIPDDRIEQIYNGVDTRRFEPSPTSRAAITGSPFARPEFWLIGTVGRLQVIKDQGLLARAFVRAIELSPAARERLRLVFVGDGPLRSEVQQVLEQAGAADLAWLAGSREDIPQILRGLDSYASPSRAEGISNTILEAMACALPIVATDVGGNGELLEGGAIGRLVPARDVDAMARALLDDVHDPAEAKRRGRAARAAVERSFSLDAMVAGYGDLYDRLLEQAAARGAQRHRFT